RVRALRAAGGVRGGVVGQLAGAAEPRRLARVLVEIQQRVGAAGARAAERRADARLVPRRPGAELRELQPARLAEEAVEEREEEEVPGGAVAPAGDDLVRRTVDLHPPVHATALVPFEGGVLFEALDEAGRQRIAGR